MPYINIDSSKIKETLMNSKKYFLVYLVLIIIASISMMKVSNYAHPKMEILMICFVSIMGMLFITHHMYNDDDKHLYKTVFIVLIVFCLLTSVFIPLNSVSDEKEHLIRAEITSRGILFPEPNNGSFMTISSIYTFFGNNGDATLFNANGDEEPINQTLTTTSMAFEQNPFYGYLLSGLGVFIAKLFNLNVIWMLWLGRMFNAIFYAAVIAYAVKIIPKFKMIIFAISSLPVCLFQACSLSLDSFVTCIGIFIVAYFIYLCENKFTKRHLIIFSVLCLLIGLCKLPYLALVFLLLFIPKENFNNENYYLYVALGIIFISIIGLLWSNYATEVMKHSWRSVYLMKNHVNIHDQINFILSNPKSIFTYFSFILNYSNCIFNGFFNLYSVSSREYCGSQFISLILLIFYGFICLGYPYENKLNLKTRLGILLTFSVIYIGIFFVMLLSWTPVGQLKIVGVHTRYFLPLFALLPFALNNNTNTTNNTAINNYIFVLIIFFISSLILSLTMTYY